MGGDVMNTPRIVYNTDCEGPTVCNDNAFEAAIHFIPCGKVLFEQLSLFDDYTAYVKERPQYNAGDTLRLLLPFLKAKGVTDKKFSNWTRSKPIKWVKGAKEAVAFARQQNLDTYEISASYRPFATLVASAIQIPEENIYCTDLNLDRFQMTEAEAQRVSEIAEAIVKLPELSKINLKTPAQRFSKEQRGAFEACEHLIWDELAGKLPCSAQILSEVRAMGGTEKTAAIFDAIRRAGAAPSDAVYVADSITDVEAFRELRHRGGVTIAFNGNEYAVEAAEYAAWGRSSLVNALLLAVFIADGREGLTRFCDSEGKEKSRNKLVVTVLEMLEESGLLWGCARVSERNLARVVTLSGKFRKEQRDLAASLT